MKKSRENNQGAIKKRVIRLLPIAIGIGVGVYLSFSGRSPEFLWNQGFRPILTLLFILLGSLFLAIQLHEMGHLFAGKFLGYQLYSFRVGMLAWQRENGKMRFSVIPNRGYGGLCAMIPGERTDQKSFALYALGGVLMNSVTGGGALLYLLHGEGFSRTMTLVLETFGVLSLALAALNLIPFLSAGQPTDGKIFFSILRGDPLAVKLLRNTTVSQKLLGGIRPRELDLPSLEGEVLDFQDLQYLLLLYFQAMDREKEETMEELIQRIEAQFSVVPELARPPFHYEMAQHHAMEGNEDLARFHTRAAGSIFLRDEDLNGLRVKAYLAWYLDGDKKKARDLIEKARSVKEMFPFPGQALMEADLLHALERRMEVSPSVGASETTRNRFNEF